MYFISVICCYYFVRWTVNNISVCRKVNRQYKHNLSCTVHDHRRLYQRITVRRHFTESFTRNAIITDDFVDGLRPSAFHRECWKCHNHRRLCNRITVRRHLSAVHNYRQIHRQTVRIPKGGY
jgi:hypothetical protein